MSQVTINDPTEFLRIMRGLWEYVEGMRDGRVGAPHPAVHNKAGELARKLDMLESTYDAMSTYRVPVYFDVDAPDADNARAYIENIMSAIDDQGLIVDASYQVDDAKLHLVPRELRESRCFGIGDDVEVPERDAG